MIVVDEDAQDGDLTDEYINKKSIQNMLSAATDKHASTIPAGPVKAAFKAIIHKVAAGVTKDAIAWRAAQKIAAEDVGLDIVTKSDKVPTPSGTTSKAPRISLDKKHMTSFWEVYNPALHISDTVTVIRPGKNHQVSVSEVTHYPLFMEKLEIEKMNIPLFCRLDDLTINVLLQQQVTPKFLSESWPVKFDRRGIVRATRLPLGRPYKIWITTGEVDDNGYVATAGDRG